MISRGLMRVCVGGTVRAWGRSLPALGALVLLSACINETYIAPTNDDTVTDTVTDTGTDADTDTGTDTAKDLVQERLGLTDAQVLAILDFLNDCATDLEVLDDDVPLDADAASALIEHRDGRDGSCGTGDDDRYDDLMEVDAVPQVGDASILAVWEYLQGGSQGNDDEWEWDGVTFTEHEVEVVLEIANKASYEVLDVDVDLPSNAVDNIIDARPHDTMDHLADTPQVGPSALEKLKAYVPVWEG